MEINCEQGNNATKSGVIVESASAVTLVGGAPILSADLTQCLQYAPCLVAADGGAAHALDAGHMPEAVIGDFDSFDPSLYPELPAECLHVIAEQSSTDFDKALRNIVAPFVLALGFTGARFDHQLAACHVLLAHPEKRCVLVGERDLVLHLPASLSLHLPVGTRLSLFPLQEVAGRSEGLQWPIDGLPFHPARCIGTSNAVSAPEVRLDMQGAGMLLILPRAHLGALIAALTSG